MSPTIDLSDPAPPQRWWLPAVFWTAGVLLYAIVLWLQIGLPFVIAFTSSAVYLYTLALVTIPGRRWSRTFIARRPTAAGLLQYLGISVVTFVVWFGLHMLYERLTIGPKFWDVVYAGNFLFQLVFGVAVFGMVQGVTLVGQGWERDRERERQEAAQAIVARDAELGVIRSQFQPHFVLNALNSLLALIDRDPALARTMVVRLADVMKAVFEGGDSAAVPFDRELALVKSYLEVEQIRFGPRLTTAFEVDEAARGVMVPPFILQPLVENAIKHGVAPFTHPGTVRIVARIAGSRLTIEVRDTGASPSVSEAGTGRGLQITRRRLEAVYGSDCDLALVRGAGGTTVRLALPVTMEMSGVA